MWLSHRSIKRSAIVTATLLLIAGCAGQSASGIPYATPGLAAFNEDSLERAGARSFLYVSDSGTDDVQVYGWPKPLNPVATLTGFNEPQGLCNDGKSAYVANTGVHNIVVYAAGATSPSRSIPDPDGYPIGCSFDPAFGNLAVVNIINDSYGQGSIDIYRNARGKPRNVTSKKLFKPYAAQYDGSGNLFIVGTNSSYVSELAELRANTKHMKIICPSLNLGSFTGGIGWDGTHIVVGGVKGSKQGLYELNGCKPIDFIPIGVFGEFAIDENRLVEADPGSAAVDMYSYPRGRLISTVTGFSEPIGVTIVPSKQKP